MKFLICFIVAFMAFSNAFAAKNPTFVPSHLRNKTLQLDVTHVDSLMVEQCADGTKELQIKGNTELNANTTFDLQNVNAIKLLNGKNPDDKVTFYMNGEKYTYKVSEIKAITIRTIERAN